MENTFKKKYHWYLISYNLANNQSNGFGEHILNREYNTINKNELTEIKKTIINELKLAHQMEFNIVILNIINLGYMTKKEFELDNTHLIH